MRSWGAICAPGALKLGPRSSESSCPWRSLCRMEAHAWVFCPSSGAFSHHDEGVSIRLESISLSAQLASSQCSRKCLLTQEIGETSILCFKRFLMLWGYLKLVAFVSFWKGVAQDSDRESRPKLTCASWPLEGPLQFPCWSLCLSPVF